MAFYYLETNALINLRRDLGLLKVPRGLAYTSALSLLELLKGISETSYAAKRRLLRSIQASKITIEWDMPRDRIRAAYRLAPVPDQDRRHSHVGFAREDGNPLADALGDRCITVS